MYADGRLIRLGVSRDNGTPLRGFLEQRLTREGVKLLRSEIVSAGGFGHAQPPPGSESLPRQPPTIQVRKGDRLVPLRWASDLERLEARLTDPESWLPASAWKQRKIRAYVPSRFEVCAAAVVSDLDKPRMARLTDASSSHRGSATGGSPERAPRQGLECERSRAWLLRSDNQRSPLARQGSRRCRARKEGRRISELHIRCPRPEPTGLDRLLAVPPARRDHLLAVRMSSRVL